MSPRFRVRHSFGREARQSSVGLWLLMSFAASCAGGSETGNPTIPTQFGLLVRSSDPTIVDIGTNNQGAAIIDAWVAVGKFAFLRDGECDLLDSYPHIGPTFIATNLVASAVTVEIGVPKDSLCGMVVPIEIETQGLSSDAPSELANHSIVLHGQRADGIPFTLAFPQEDELELQVLDSVLEITGGDSLFLSFDVAMWMRDVDLDAATVSNGSILIDEAHNVDQLAAFEANMDCSLELFADTNGSGALEAGDTLVARCPTN